MNAALYMRMSTDKQESSIDSQESALRAYASARGIAVTARYADEGLSGRTAAKRPAFMRLIEDSAGGSFDTVLVFDSSRFARNLEESIVYKSALRKNGVELISATEPTPEGDGALLTDAMLGALNEMHSRKLAAAVRRGMEYKAGQGYYQVPPPYGYKKAGRETAPDEAEARAVKMAFRRFLECGSCHDTAQALNSAGIFKRRGGLWQGRDIKRMLANPAYTGAVYYNGKVFPGRHEPIIDRQIWEAAQRDTPRRAKKARPASTYRHWLSGLIKCAGCGGTMGYVSGRNGRGSFRCSRHANGACGKSGHITAAVMEALAESALRALAEGCPLTYVRDTERVRLAGESDAESLRRRLRRVDEKLARHKAAYAEGVDTLEEYRGNRQKCEQMKTDIHKLLEEAERAKRAEQADGAESRPSAGILDIIGLLPDKTPGNEISPAQKSAAVRSLIREMVFDKDTRELKVCYKAPREAYPAAPRIPYRHAAADAGPPVCGEGNQHH